MRKTQITCEDNSCHMWESLCSTSGKLEVTDASASGKVVNTNVIEFLASGELENQETEGGELDRRTRNLPVPPRGRNKNRLFYGLGDPSVPVPRF